jgi:hypothetical protein
VVASAHQGTDAVGSAGFPSWGASMTSNMIGTPDMTVVVHWWFDVGVAVRYRVHYLVQGNNCVIP